MNLHPSIKRAKRKSIRLRVGMRRCFAIQYLGDGKILFECKQGHRFTHQQKASPTGDRAEAFLKRFAAPGGYWTREGGGCHALCPQCLTAQYKAEGV